MGNIEYGPNYYFFGFYSGIKEINIYQKSHFNLWIFIFFQAREVWCDLLLKPRHTSRVNHHTLQCAVLLRWAQHLHVHYSPGLLYFPHLSKKLPSTKSLYGHWNLDIISESKTIPVGKKKETKHFLSHPNQLPTKSYKYKHMCLHYTDQGFVTRSHLADEAMLSLWSLCY